MDEMMSKERMQFVVLGTGEEKYENMLRYFEQKFPGKVKADIGYSEERAHLIYAGCDAFLMPSLFEPCGLSQLISMRYGTLPIVRETGGLKDTVIAYNEYEQTGTGFSFANYNAHEMYHTIRYAMEVYYKHREAWDCMAVRAMKQDFSWKNSAREYERLYEQL
jgi:starch synthase